MAFILFQELFCLFFVFAFWSMCAESLSQQIPKICVVCVCAVSSVLVPVSQLH